MTRVSFWKDPAWRSARYWLRYPEAGSFVHSTWQASTLQSTRPALLRSARHSRCREKHASFAARGCARLYPLQWDETKGTYISIDTTKLRQAIERKIQDPDQKNVALRYVTRLESFLQELEKQKKK